VQTIVREDSVVRGGLRVRDVGAWGELWGVSGWLLYLSRCDLT